MDEKKVKESIERLTLSDNARNRIIDNCASIIEAENKGDVTEYTLSTANARRHRIVGFAVSAAACAAIVGGGGAVMKMMKSPASDSVVESQTVSSSHSVVETQETTEALEPPKTFENLRPEIIELTSSERGDVAEFLKAACDMYGVNFIEKDYMPYNIIASEITEKYGFSVFKYGEFEQAYLFYRGKVYVLGNSFGGTGIMSMALADIDGDKYPELYYTYSYGSGVNGSAVDYIEINDAPESVVLLNSITGYEFTLSVENDSLNVTDSRVIHDFETGVSQQKNEIIGSVGLDDSGEIVVHIKNGDYKDSAYADHAPSFYDYYENFRNKAILNEKEYVLTAENYKNIDRILAEQSNEYKPSEPPLGKSAEDFIFGDNRPAEPFIRMFNGQVWVEFYDIDGHQYINIYEATMPLIENYWFMLPEGSDVPDRIKKIILQGMEYSEGNVFGKDFPTFIKLFRQHPHVEVKCGQAVPELTEADFVSIDNIIESYGSGIMPAEPLKFPNGVSPTEPIAFITDSYEIWFYDIIGDDDVIKTVVKNNGSSTEKCFRIYYEEQKEIDVIQRIISVITNTDKSAEYASLNTIPLLQSEFRVTYLDKERKVTEIPMDDESRMTIRSCIASECGFARITEEAFGSQDDVEVYTISCEGEILELNRSGKARYTTKDGRVYHYTYTSERNNLMVHCQ